MTETWFPLRYNEAFKNGIVLTRNKKDDLYKVLSTVANIL